MFNNGHPSLVFIAPKTGIDDNQWRNYSNQQWILAAPE